MAEIIINGVEKREVVTAFKVMENQSEYLMLLTEKYVDGNRITESLTKELGQEKFHSISSKEEWNIVKKEYYVLHCLRGEKEGVSYIEVPTQIMTEDSGNELALRQENLDTIKDHYDKALQSLRASKVEPIPAELSKEEVNVSLNTINSTMRAEGSILPDNSIVDMSANAEVDTSKMEDIKNEPIDVTNMIFTPREEDRKEENIVPVIEDVSKNESILETPVSEPVSIPTSDSTSVPEVTPSTIPTAKSEEPSKIMEAIETPNEMLHEVNNMPSIVDAPKQDNNNIVNFPSVNSENIIVNNGVQEASSKTAEGVDQSVVVASYMEDIDKSIVQMKQATENMKSAYEMMKSAYEQMNKAMNLVENTGEKVKESSLESIKQIRDRDMVSRQTFEKAQRVMATQMVSEEEQSLKRTA